jgi:hypothetical protein
LKAPAKGRLLTIREAAKQLRLEATFGEPERWLRRHLRRREVELKMRLLVQVGSSTKRPTYRVHESALRLACPELYDPHERVAQMVNARSARIERRIASVEAMIEDVQSSVAGIGHLLRRR